MSAHRSHCRQPAFPIPHSRFPIPGLQSGFTLIEVLLATVLLAAGLALAFATLRASTATVERGEALAARSERMRAVEGFLRRRLASAQPIGFATDTSTGNVFRFVGEPERMRFVADLPDYLGRGGPHLHDVAVYDDRGGARLAVSFAMVLAGESVEEENPRPPEPLVPDLSEVRFRYRGLDAENRLTEWMDTWEAVDQLPLQVSIEIASADGGVWPPLVVALPQSTGGAGSVIGTGESGLRPRLNNPRSRLRGRR
jgi:general secretion pathway protein J